MREVFARKRGSGDPGGVRQGELRGRFDAFDVGHLAERPEPVERGDVQFVFERVPQRPHEGRLLLGKLAFERRQREQRLVLGGDEVLVLLQDRLRLGDGRRGRFAWRQLPAVELGGPVAAGVAEVVDLPHRLVAVQLRQLLVEAAGLRLQLGVRLPDVGQFGAGGLEAAGLNEELHAAELVGGFAALDAGGEQAEQALVRQLRSEQPVVPVEVERLDLDVARRDERRALCEVEGAAVGRDADDPLAVGVEGDGLVDGPDGLRLVVGATDAGLQFELDLSDVLVVNDGVAVGEGLGEVVAADAVLDGVQRVDAVAACLGEADGDAGPLERLPVDAEAVLECDVVRGGGGRDEQGGGGEGGAGRHGVSLGAVRGRRQGKPPAACRSARGTAGGCGSR